VQKQMLKVLCFV